MKANMLQQAVGHNPILKRATAAARAAEQVAQPDRAARTGIAAVWRDTCAAFATHAAPVLFFAMLGFALPAILGSGIRALVAYHHYWSRGIHTPPIHDMASPPAALVIEGVLGVMGLALASGAIMHVVLHEAGCSAAGRRAYARLRSLLFGSLVYGALMALSLMGLHRALLTLAPGEIVSRSLDALLPNTGAPHELLLRLTPTAPTSKTACVNSPSVAVDPRVVMVCTSNQSSVFDAVKVDAQLIALAAVALIILSEALLRFRMVTSLPASIWLGFRHFGAITLHAWSLRIALLAISVLFIIGPMVVVEHVIVPAVPHVAGDAWMQFPVGLIMPVSHAIVNAMLVAFSVLYDARLYAALRGAAIARPGESVAPIPAMRPRRQA